MIISLITESHGGIAYYKVFFISVVRKKKTRMCVLWRTRKQERSKLQMNKGVPGGGEMDTNIGMINHFKNVYR